MPGIKALMSISSSRPALNRNSSLPAESNTLQKSGEFANILLLDLICMNPPEAVGSM